jgi:hypothetical protein
VRVYLYYGRGGGNAQAAADETMEKPYYVVMSTFDSKLWSIRALSLRVAARGANQK